MSLFLVGLVLDSFAEEKTQNEKLSPPTLTDPKLEIKLFQTGLDYPGPSLKHFCEIVQVISVHVVLAGNKGPSVIFNTGV